MLTSAILRGPVRSCFIACGLAPYKLRCALRPIQLTYCHTLGSVHARSAFLLCLRMRAPHALCAYVRASVRASVRACVAGCVPCADVCNCWLYDRYSTRRQRSLVYKLPVPMPGDYAVRLHFAETCECATEPGQRIFDIELEGTVASTLDIVKEAGWRRSYSLTVMATVIDGELTLEMLGIVRNPVLSGIEVAGPIAYPLQITGQQAPAGERLAHDADVLSAEPPDTALEVDGEIFDLAHVSTGTLHRLDFRFSVAYDSNSTVRLFRRDAARVDTTLDTFQVQCARECTRLDSCVGVFVRTLTTTYYCNGLRELGHPVGTTSVSRSWKRANAVAVDQTKQPVLLGATTLDAAAAWSGEQGSLVFQGRTRANSIGPWLTFSTSFDRHQFVFAEDLSAQQCIQRCQVFPSCHGVVMWIPPDEEIRVLSCIGLKNLGTTAGIETDLNCVSVRVVRKHSWCAGSEFQQYMLVCTGAWC